MTELLTKDVQNHILVLLRHSKSSLIKDFMVHLASAENFEEYVAFIQDPVTFTKSLIAKLSNDVTFEEETKYADMANSRVHQIVCQLSKSIQVANGKCSILGQSNVDPWIDIFLNHVHNYIHLPLSPDILMYFKRRNVLDITNVTKILLDTIKDKD